MQRISAARRAIAINIARSGRPRKERCMTRNELTGHKETFYFTSGKALSVLLAGDFTHWQASPVPLRKGADGVWRASVTLSPGRHTYRFIVDGEWRDDPECAIHVPNPYGGENMVRKVA
jgi:1,4-alpha-glucan branching enzyme